MEKRKPSLARVAGIIAVVTLAVAFASGYVGVRFFDAPFYFGFWAMLVFAGLIGLFVMASAATNFTKRP